MDVRSGCRRALALRVSATGYTNADEVLHDAETALHRARVLGGSHCEVFDTAILKSEQAELQLEDDFEAALQRREFDSVVPADRLAGVERDPRIRGAGAMAASGPRHDCASRLHPIAEQNRIHRAARQLDPARGVPPAHRVAEQTAAVERRSRCRSTSPACSCTHAALVDEIAEALRDSGLESQSPGAGADRRDRHGQPDRGHDRC